MKNRQLGKTKELNFLNLGFSIFFHPLRLFPVLGRCSHSLGECFLCLFLVFSIKESSSVFADINKNNGIK